MAAPAPVRDPATAVEPNWPEWCGRFSQVILNLLACETLGEADIDRRFARAALVEYDTQLTAWRASLGLDTSNATGPAGPSLDGTGADGARREAV